MKSVITWGPVICTKLCPCQHPVGNSAIMSHTYNNKKKSCKLEEIIQFESMMDKYYYGK